MTESNVNKIINKKMNTLGEGIKRWQDIPQILDICDQKIKILPKFISVHYIEKDIISTMIDDGGLIQKNTLYQHTGLATKGMIGTETKGFSIGYGSVENFSRQVTQIKKAIDTSMDLTVKYALKCYLQELSLGITIKNGKNFSRLSADEILSFQGPVEECYGLEKKEISKLVGVSKDLLRHRYINSSTVDIKNALDKHYFSDSEGRRIFNSTNQEVLTITVKFDHESGSKKTYTKNILNPNYRNLDNILDKSFNEIIQYVNEESTAPPIKSGQYPIIFGPGASGTTFHEGLGGHLLSGEYICTGVSTVFRDKIGEAIMPLEITVIDNPLNPKASGFYLFDEEGIPAKKTTLIEKGVLKNYLLNRNSAAHLGTISNGHARSEWVCCFNEEGNRIPVLPEPRTSNMEIYSSLGVSNKKLEKMLTDHCRKEGLEFGLYIDAGAGQVNVGTSGFMIFPHTMWKIYTNGKKERVTDGIVVGNAYELLKQIAGIGNKPQITLGTCGASSGGVPVQESAPAIFLPKVTVTAIDQKQYTKNLIDE